MSGYFNYYKIDTNRTSINLLPKLTDLKLPQKKHSYFPDRLIPNFKDYITEINKGSISTPLSFEKIIFKIKTDFYQINHSEFEIIINRVNHYFHDELEDTEEFHINLGFTEVSTLHSRFENQILYIGEYGLNLYYQKTTDKENLPKKVSTDMPANVREIKLVIDFLLILSIKFIISDTKVNITKRQELIDKLKKFRRNNIIKRSCKSVF